MRVASTLDPAAVAAPRRQVAGAALRRAWQAVRAPVAAFAATVLVFGLFMAIIGRNPVAVYGQMFKGAFGTWCSFQNTLLRAAPFMLTALATALPGRLGLGVLGGEGAMVLGGLVAAIAGLAAKNHGHGPITVAAWMLVAGSVTGGVWIALAGALRAYRGVNETIATLLLNYIAIALLNHFVEGPLRDPASLNTPSPTPIGDEHMIRTLFGFSARMSGGNVRAALLIGLPVARLIVIVTFLAGACAGLAGSFEVAAIHGTATASLITGYGYTGVLVA